MSSSPVHVMSWILRNSTSLLNHSRKQLLQSATQNLHTGKHVFAAASSGAADHPGQKRRRPTTADAENLMDIGTRYLFDEDNDIFRAATRKFYKEHVLPNQTKYEDQGFIDREVWLKLSKNGMLGMSIPQEYGGLGGDLIDYVIPQEECTYANDLAPAFGFHELLAGYLLKYGSEEIKKNFLVPAAKGEFILCLGMTEPGAGSDVQAIKTYAKRDGTDWIINGSKMFITNGIQADVAIVAAVTNPNAKKIAYGVSLFVVPTNTPGFSRSPKPLKKLGYHASDTAALYFDDLRLPGKFLLGEENKGMFYMNKEFAIERMIIALQSICNCERMFEQTRAYIKSRKAFGKTLADLQTVQHKMAELKTNICVARTFFDECYEKLEHNELSNDMAAMCKLWLCGLEPQVANECLQLHGGSGYMWESQIAKDYASARLAPIYGGANEIMKEMIGRSIVYK